MTNLLGLMIYLLAGGFYLVGMSISVLITLSRKYGLDKACEALSEATELLNENGEIDWGLMNVMRNLIFWPVCYYVNAMYLKEVVVAICEEQ